MSVSLCGSLCVMVVRVGEECAGCLMALKASEAEMPWAASGSPSLGWLTLYIMGDSMSSELRDLDWRMCGLGGMLMGQILWW